jgi:NAD(P)H dehydrogenase (quinone)
MPKTLVLFYSRTGHTAALADAVAEGAGEVRFAEVDVRRVDDLAPAHVVEADARWSETRARLAGAYRTLESVERLAEYDAIVLGAPARHGVMAAELKHVLDQAAPLWERGALADKVGSAFTSVHPLHGGHHATLWSVLTAMGNLGMLLVPPAPAAPPPARPADAYPVPPDHAGRPADAYPVPPDHAGRPADADLAVARQQGRRVATVAEWVRHAKSHHH